MKLAFIGIGNVGFALADNLQKKGHQIIIGHDNPNSESVKKAQNKNQYFEVQLTQKAINNSDLVLLAVPYNNVEKILKPLKFHEKTLVDCTNPVGKGISHGLESKISGAEVIQKLAPDANVVKSYTIYGYENLVDSNFIKYNVQPVMLVAGNNLASKKEVTLLNSDLGYNTLDVGDLSQSLHLEHMTLLWVKMVRVNGHHPNFTWAYLEK